MVALDAYKIYVYMVALDAYAEALKLNGGGETHSDFFLEKAL